MRNFDNYRSGSLFVVHLSLVTKALHCTTCNFIMCYIQRAKNYRALYIKHFFLIKLFYEGTNIDLIDIGNVG